MELKRIVSLLAVFLLLCQPLSVFGFSLGNAPSPDVQEAGTIPESKYHASGKYPVCSDGKITEPCKCGEKAYNAGFCCRGIWFDPYYENIFSNNTCPAGNFYFVDQNHPNASDDNPGTEELPWKTIQHAANLGISGDVIIVKDGIYHEEGALYPSSSIRGIKPQNSGTEENPIIYKAYPGHKPIIDQNYQYIGFYLFDKSYIVIDGFEIRNSNNAGIRTGGCNHIIIQNCHIHHVNGSAGSNVGAVRLNSCSWCTARNNILHDVYVAGDMENQNSAALHSYDMEYAIIENNEMFNAANGVFHKRSSGNKGAIIRKNIIHDVRLYGIRYSIGGTGDPPHKDQEVYQNIFYNCPRGICVSCKGTSGDSIGLFVYNNVFHTEGGISISRYKEVETWNNIFYENEDKYGRGSIITVGDPSLNSITYSDYNLFYPTTRFELNLYTQSHTIYTSLSDWQNDTGFDLNSTSSDPFFINPESHNFHLQPSSPCLNAGIDRQDYDNDGNTTEPINMGCYITGNETIGPIDLSQYIVEESLQSCPEGFISSPCLCKNPETDQTQEYSSGYCYNGYWHNKSWEEFVIWEDSFDDGVPMEEKYFEYNDDEGEFITVDYEYFTPPYSLRAKYQEGEVSAGGFKKSFGRTPSNYIGKNAAKPDQDFREIYWRFYMKMQEGWEGSPAKVCRATILAREDWSQAMIAHLWSSEEYLLIDPASGIDENGNLITQGYNDFDHLIWLGYRRGVTPIFSTENSGKWYCIEAHVKLDDPGQNNGIFEFWIDGNLEARRDDLAWVKNWSEYGINALFFANYWNSGSLKEQERYFDDLVIATERTGCKQIFQPTCASQNGVCCQENQTCQNGIFISSSDCGNLCCTGECVSPQLPGDLNDDGHVNVQDIQLNVNVILEIENRPDIIARADVNRDGSVNILDVQRIVNAVLNA